MLGREQVPWGRTYSAPMREAVGRASADKLCVEKVGEVAVEDDVSVFELRLFAIGEHAR